MGTSNDTDLLIEKINNSFSPIENNFLNTINEIQKVLQNLENESKKVIDSGDDFADQFGNKVRKIVTEINKPERISIQDLSAYINVLQNFQKEILYYGSKFIGNIGFRHKINITRIENHRRKVHSLTQDLQNLLLDYQEKLKNRERAEKAVVKIIKLENEISSNKQRLNELNKKINELKIQTNQFKEKIQVFREEKDLKAFREFREVEESFEERIKSNLNHLEKPILKSLKLVERGVIEEDKNKIIILERFIRDPKNMLLNFTNVKIINDALKYLQKLLKEKKLNLKTSRKKKALEEISNLLSENRIITYRNKFAEYKEKKQKKLESAETLEKAGKLKKTQNELDKKKEAYEKLIIEKNKIEDRLSYCKEKVSEYNKKLEEFTEN